MIANIIRVVSPDRIQGRGLYWAPDSKGYTNDLAQAGRYTLGVGSPTYTEVPEWAFEVADIVEPRSWVTDLFGESWASGSTSRWGVYEDRVELSTGRFYGRLDRGGASVGDTMRVLLAMAGLVSGGAS